MSKKRISKVRPRRAGERATKGKGTRDVTFCCRRRRRRGGEEEPGARREEGDEGEGERGRVRS